MKHQNTSKLFSKNRINKQNNSNNIHKNSIQIVCQKESSHKGCSKVVDILNHPSLKRRLPPLDKSNSEIINENEKLDNEANISKNLQEEINFNIEKLKKRESEIKNEQKEEIKDSLELDNERKQYKILENIINKDLNKEKYNNENNQEKIVVKEKIIKNDMEAGTSCYTYNIQELKDESNNKTKLILKLSDEQNDYKDQLNSLLNKLNILIEEHADFLYKEDDELENSDENEENINKLYFQLEQRKKDFNATKNQNKIFKQQYELLINKDKNLNNENFEKKYDLLKTENSELSKQISRLKAQTHLDEKKLKNNGKHLTDINKIMNELKTLENKKHEYFKKYSNNYKLIENCIKEFENLEKFYLNQKNTKNYFNAKVEEEINRLKDDLTPNKEEIIKRIENDTSFIVRKMLHNEKIRENILKTPIPYKPADITQMRLKKRASFDKLKIRRINHSGKNRKINIYAKEQTPNLINDININKDKSELDINTKNYDEMSDYEYRDMLSKKEHFSDIILKLEKSVKESQKMYQRKIRDIKNHVEDNERKLAAKKNENELLKIEIDNLSKLLAISEEENKIMNEQNKNLNKNKINKNTIPTTITEKELDSQKEYLSPDYYPNENNNLLTNKLTKEKTLIPTNSNTDVTRNEILNDLKALNSQNLEDPIQDSEILRKNKEGKINNLTMKFPDLSNIEENVNSNLKNDEERNKIIDDIKKKYNIDDNDMNDDFILENKNEDDFENMNNKNINKNKFFYEHENALDEKIGENNDNIDEENILKYDYKYNNENMINDNNNNYDKKKENFSEEQNNDSLEQI